ncbi:Ig-like domain-containing protein [Ligilactobacillus equi]|uniref:Ig-like domain-containing protein n=1 Tax=Ligilactobacillus equi TaxID=137357 RepID=UPI0004684FFE|nr:Ig-like domain-containing protein [Ligilactobacillus equi]
MAPSGVEVADNGTTVTGKAAPGAEVVVADKDGNVLGKATADKDGNFAVELSTPQTNGEKLAVSAKEADKQPATTTAVAPKVDKSGLNQAIADGKEATQGDNYAQANQADKDALDKALEAGKQVTANPAATQVEVNNAKKLSKMPLTVLTVRVWLHLALK